jgi:hypothetical protein
VLTSAMSPPSAHGFLTVPGLPTQTATSTQMIQL